MDGQLAESGKRFFFYHTQTHSIKISDLMIISPLFYFYSFFLLSLVIFFWVNVLAPEKQMHNQKNRWRRRIKKEKNESKSLALHSRCRHHFDANYKKLMHEDWLVEMCQHKHGWWLILLISVLCADVLIFFVCAWFGMHYE